jgi:hypothetical protein
LFREVLKMRSSAKSFFARRRQRIFGEIIALEGAEQLSCLSNQFCQFWHIWLP